MLTGMADVAESAAGENERRFGWWDMFTRPEDDPRSDGGFKGELATLVGYLKDQRLTLEMKCSGLDAEGLARRSVPPSNMSLLGLVRHMAGVEHSWFRRVLGGQDLPRLYRSEEDRDADFNGATGDAECVAEAWEAWRREVAFAEGFVTEAPSLEVSVVHEGEELTLREVLVHMIEEYARHNGHADLLRECVDGRVGQ